MQTLSRRISVATVLCMLAFAGGCASHKDLISGRVPPPTTSPDGALAALMAGNERYVADKPIHGSTHAARRGQVAQSQSPIAIIVSCADSRVGPEIVFDQDLGDIFVVRSAGNVVDDVQLGSIEYAVEHLHSSLIMVVGHERCGAVKAAVEGGHAPGHLGAFLHHIEPAVETTKGMAGDKVDNAVAENVRNVVKQLKAAGPVVAEAVNSGKIMVVGARYDLDTGRVEEVR